MVAVGVDACKGGWIAVVLRNDASSAHFLASIVHLATVVPDATVVGIDIPIGVRVQGVRAADVAAKAVLGARRNSVFMTPVRAALQASTHAEATATSVRLAGLGISQQSYALRSKIFEVEEWLSGASCDVREVHPEVSFAVQLGHPARSSKKKWHGMIERRAALASVGIELDHIDQQVGGRASVDDMLDAGIAAWSAERVRTGTALPFPQSEEFDELLGRRIAIWA